MHRYFLFLTSRSVLRLAVDPTLVVLLLLLHDAGLALRIKAESPLFSNTFSIGVLSGSTSAILCRHRTAENLLGTSLSRPSLPIYWLGLTSNGSARLIAPTAFSLTGLSVAPSL